MWYADDATGAGSLNQLKNWWDCIKSDGTYDANSTKTWLIVKEEHHEQALEIFAGTGVQITSIGKRHLGETKPLLMNMFKKK